MNDQLVMLGETYTIDRGERTKHPCGTKFSTHYSVAPSLRLGDDRYGRNWGELRFGACYVEDQEKLIGSYEQLGGVYLVPNQQVLKILADLLKAAKVEYSYGYPKLDLSRMQAVLDKAGLMSVAYHKGVGRRIGEEEWGDRYGVYEAYIPREEGEEEVLLFKVLADGANGARRKLMAKAGESESWDFQRDWTPWTMAGCHVREVEYEQDTKPVWKLPCNGPLG